MSRPLPGWAAEWNRENGDDYRAEYQRLLEETSPARKAGKSLTLGEARTQYERNLIVDITPSPEFLEACRRILGGDDPATVLGAMMSGDPRMDDVRALHADLVEEQENGKPSVVHREQLAKERPRAKKLHRREAD